MFIYFLIFKAKDIAFSNSKPVKIIKMDTRKICSWTMKGDLKVKFEGEIRSYTSRLCVMFCFAFTDITTFTPQYSEAGAVICLTCPAGKICSSSGSPTACTVSKDL